MFSQSLNPVTSPGMIYPTFPSPRGQDFRCPTCHSTNRTHICSVIFTPGVVKELNKALTEWNDWVFKQGVTGVFKGVKKLEGYNFSCGWCETNWFVASELILNSIIVDQINQIHEFTDKTKKEFGALILRNNRGICLDMIQIGEELAISFDLTRPLEQDEEILGTIHCHPVSDTFSHWDVITAINNPWETVSAVVGAEGTLVVMVKLPGTKGLTENLNLTVKRWEDENRSVDDIAAEYNFLVYRGKPSSMQLVSGQGMTTTLEELLRGVKGSKCI